MIPVLIFIVLAICVLGLVSAWKGAKQLVYPPHRRPAASPADYGLGSESVSFVTPDGLTLRGWFIPAPDPKGTIVLCHGYSGDCSPDLKYAPRFQQAGYNTLFFDFRGHGASDGDYTSLVYFERQDLLAALRFLEARGIKRVCLLGLSMGGAVALATASLSPLVIGVVSDSTFGEIDTVVRQAYKNSGVYEPVASVLGWLVIQIASLRLRANLATADPIRWVGQIAPRPLLIMHGESDKEVPVSQARKLFGAACKPKELWIVPKAEHREIEAVAPDEYLKRLVDFFDRTFAKPLP